MFISLIILGLIALLFPIFLTINLHVDVLEQKLYFSFYVLKFIKIYGGYATLYKKGIAFHMTKNKAILLPFNQMHNSHKKFEITKGFYMLAYSQIIEVGIQKNLGEAILLASTIESLSAIVAKYFFKYKKCQSFKASLILHRDKNVAKGTARLILVFNLLILVIAFIKLIIEKIRKKVKNNERKKIYE